VGTHAIPGKQPLAVYAGWYYPGSVGKNTGGKFARRQNAIQILRCLIPRTPGEDYYDYPHYLLFDRIIAAQRQPASGGIIDSHRPGRISG